MNTTRFVVLRRWPATSTRPHETVEADAICGTLHSAEFVAARIHAGAVDHLSLIERIVSIDVATGTGTDVTADIARIVQRDVFDDYSDDLARHRHTEELVGFVEQTLHLIWCPHRSPYRDDIEIDYADGQWIAAPAAVQRRAA